MAPYLLLILVGLAVAASAAVWSAVLWRWNQGLPILPAHDTGRPAWSPVAFGITLVVLAFTVAARLRLIPRVAEPQDEPPLPSLEFVQAHAAVSLVLLMILLAVLAHAGRRGLADFGIRREDWPRQIAVGGLTAVVSVLPVLSVLLATAAWRTEERQHPLLRLLAESDQWTAIAWIALAVVVIAPLLEELMYRVILQGTFERFTRPSVAIVGVAVVFSAVHNPIDVLPLVPLALILGYVYHRTRSYLTVVTAHAAFNLANLLMALAAGGGNGPLEPLPPAGSWFPQ